MVYSIDKMVILEMVYSWVSHISWVCLKMARNGPAPIVEGKSC